MSAKPRVSYGRVLVSETRACEDGAALGAGAQRLLFEGEAFEIGEGIEGCGALFVCCVISEDVNG